MPSNGSSPKVAANAGIADALERVADLLEAQGASEFRVRAYRNGAGTARAADRPLADVLALGGLEGLDRLPAIGKGLAASIRELVATGRLALLDRLERGSPPSARFRTVPGIGESLARRIHSELGIATLEELEQAAYDGRLRRVRGFGERRERLVRDALAGILARSARRRVRATEATGARSAAGPTAQALLDADAEYRRRAESGELRRIAPRRFNPTGEAWLPVLHTAREGWSITVLFSNTARAHSIGKTRDWVVLFFRRDGAGGRATVVTETHGPLAGRRVVRGREEECGTSSESGSA